MRSSCEKIKDKLIDVYYSENVLDENLKHHLNTCKECRKYFEELNDTKDILSILEKDVEIDYSLICEAFEKAEDIQSKRKSILELILFIVIATSILASIGFFASIGYGMLILKLQIVFFFGGPLMVPVMIKRKLLKEGYYNGRA